MKYFVYNEDKQHGTKEFPIEYYFVDKNHHQYVMPPHWHEEFEIIRVLAGEVLFYLNNEPKKLGCGEIIIIPGGTLHRAIPYSAIYECVVFNLSMLKKRSSSIISNYVNPFSNGDVTVASPLCEKNTPLYDAANEILKTISSPEEFYELKIYGLLYQLIFELYKNGVSTDNKKTGENRGRKTILTLLTCVEENFGESLTLEKLSELTGFNKRYICRIFKEYTSQCLTDYINDLKIDLAKHELQYTDNSITKVAYDAGFNDSGYFTKIFKKSTGITALFFKDCFLNTS